MRYLGAHTFGFTWSDSAADAVAKLAGCGFREFQLLATAPHLGPWAHGVEELATIRRSVAACHGRVLAVDLPSSETNLASTNPEVVDFSVAAYLHALDLASEVEATWLPINSGRRHALLPPPDDRLLDVYRAALDRLLQAAEARGVRLLLENIPTGLLAEAPRIRSFVETDGYDIDILYDVANAAAVGEEPADGIAALSDHISLLHLSDAPKGAWRHDPIGSGDIDFASIHDALRAIDYGGGVVIEALGDDILADLVRSRDCLARSGWTFGG